MANTLSTKEKIIELGRDFIQQVGYHSFKYQQIATVLNIKNAAIHHYFPGKEDLGVAVIKKDHQDFLKAKDTVALKNSVAKTEMLLGAYTSYFKAGKNLCVIGSCASAAAETPKQMQVAAKDYFDDLISWLSDVFKEGLKSGEFTFKEKPAELATLWMATLPGTLQLSKLNGAKFFEQSLNQLRKTYKR